MSQIPIEAKLPDAIYWPFDRLPESKLDTYARACVETALKCSEDARQYYARIVQSWEIPGCQALIGDFAQCKQDTRNWLRDRARAVVRNQPLPSYPEALVNVVAEAKDNTDFHKLSKCIADFILAAFNRKQDLENKTPKVLPGNSPHLAQTIVFFSLLDYLPENPELRGPRVISDTELAEFHWFCRLVAANPTNRRERRIRPKVIQALRRADFTLHHRQTILDIAWKWYQSRVVYTGTEEFCRTYYKMTKIWLDSANINREIAVCDLATGYVRQWRD